MKMEQTECSETSAYKIQTPGNYPEENIQHDYFDFPCDGDQKWLKHIVDIYKMYVTDSCVDSVCS